MPTQAYLDATAGGVYSSPDEWTAAAQAFEAAAISPADTADFVGAGIQDAVLVNNLLSFGVTATDAGLVATILTDAANAQDLNTVAMQAMIVAMGVAANSAGTSLTEAQMVSVLSVFLQRLEAYGLTVDVDNEF